MWPYASEVPKELSGEEAEHWYSTTPGNPVSLSQAKDLSARAVRRLPVASFRRTYLLFGSRSKLGGQNSK